jgi:DNA-binding NarL/FixJ family response regulator
LLSKGARVDDVVATVESVAEHGSAVAGAQRDALFMTLENHRREQQIELGPFDRLTRREQEVLAALIEGKTAQSIAAATFTSVRTVRGHIQSVLDKLDVSSQLAAVAKAKDAGWIPPSTSHPSR